jgi:hypothetical protein
MRFVRRFMRFVGRRLTGAAALGNLAACPSLAGDPMKTLLLPLLACLATPAFATSAACPQAAEQLTEYLASAKQRIGFDGEVRVEFDVDAAGRVGALKLQGSRPYQAPVRIAMHSLDCRGGEPQRYALDIRFAEPAPRSVAAAASATLAQADVATSVRGTTPR